MTLLLAEEAEKAEQETGRRVDPCLALDLWLRREATPETFNTLRASRQPPRL